MRSDGRRKPAFRAFANPLAVDNYGDTDSLWGLIRPQRRATRVTIEVKRTKSSRWKVLRRLTTTSTGVYGLSVAHRDKQRYRVRWTGDRRQDPGRPADPLVLSPRRATLTRRCRRSCGCSGTARPCPTTPSRPTPSAS